MILLAGFALGLLAGFAASSCREAPEDAYWRGWREGLEDGREPYRGWDEPL